MAKKEKRPPEPWPFQAAKGCWMAPGIAILVAVLLSIGTQSNPDAGATTFPVVVVLMMVCCLLGIGFGMAALTQMKQFGRKGILLPAIVGIVVDSFVLLAVVGGFINRALT